MILTDAKGLYYMTMRAGAKQYSTEPINDHPSTILTKERCGNYTYTASVIYIEKLKELRAPVKPMTK